MAIWDDILAAISAGGGQPSGVLPSPAAAPQPPPGLLGNIDVSQLSPDQQRALRMAAAGGPGSVAPAGMLSSPMWPSPSPDARSLPSGSATPPAPDTSLTSGSSANPPPPAAQVQSDQPQSQQGILPAPKRPVTLGGILGDIVGLPLNVVGSYGSAFRNALEESSIQHQRNQYALSQMEIQRRAIATYRDSLGPQQQALFDADPAGFLQAKMEGEKPQKLDAGQSLGDVHGIYSTAPVVGLDKDTGAGYAVDGRGNLTVSSNNTGPTTAIDATTGAVYDPRGGGVKGFISKYVSNPPANRDNWVTPNYTASGGQPAPNAPPADAASPSPTSDTGPASAALTSGPIVPAHVPGGANAPRGLRNNNPGNVMALPNGQQWNGQVGQDKDGYLQFATPEDGVRAAYLNLQAKQNRHGLNTVAGIIAAPHLGWDPGNDHYANYVAQRLGVDKHAPINVSDPATAKGMLNAIFAYENGPKAMAAYGRSLAANGGAAATSGAPPSAGATTQTAPPSAAPSVTQGGTVTPVYAGARPRVLTAQESQSLGAPPGTILQQTPEGTYEPMVQRSQSPLPADDQTRLNGIKELALKYSRLAQLGQQFVTINARHDTGGFRAIPGEAEVEGAFSTPVSDMNALTKEMIPLQREIGSGPIRVGEVSGPGGGIWGGDVPRIQAPRESNAHIAQNWSQTAKQYQDYANFADEWAASHPTLNGMDAAWAKQNGGTLSHMPTPRDGGEAPTRLNPKNPDLDYRALPVGARYIGPDGKLRVK